MKHVKYLKMQKIKSLYGIREVVVKWFNEIKNERSTFRQIVMNLLYRLGNFNGVERGEIIRVDYSTVIQKRKR